MPPGDQTSVAKGAVLTVLMRWIDRFVGFVSTLVLARLLVPDDFGIVAMASLAVGLTDALLDMGVHVALIQNRHATAEHYNTAWTLRLIQSLLGCAIVFLFAPYAADYFNDARIEPVLRLMSVGLVFIGLENIGVVTFQKEMRFGMDFRFVFLRRISGFLTTMIVAWFLRSYWALVIGALSGRICGVFLSYYLHSMRPRISFEKLKDIFTVSQWMLLNSLGNYLNLNLHNILVGRSTNASVVGGYTLACDISAMPTTELLAPLNRVLFPAFVKAKHNLAELKRVFLLAQSVQTLLGMPAGAGLALVAHEAVYVLLGDKWSFIVPYVQILALASVVAVITTSGSYLLMTVGKFRNAVLITWIQVFAFLLGVMLVSPGTDASLIAWLRFSTVFSGLLLSLFMMIHMLKLIGYLDILRVVARPFLGVLAMTAAIVLLGDFVRAPLAMALVIKVLAGAVVYPATVLLMWLLAGKPQGAEAYLLEKASGVWKRGRN